MSDFEKLMEYGTAQGNFTFTIHLQDGEYSSMFNFGKEAPGSPMFGGSSLGMGDSVEEVLAQMAKECRLSENAERTEA